MYIYIYIYICIIFKYIDNRQIDTYTDSHIDRWIDISISKINIYIHIYMYKYNIYNNITL